MAKDETGSTGGAGRGGKAPSARRKLPSTAAWARDSRTREAEHPGLLSEPPAEAPDAAPGITVCGPRTPCRLGKIDPDFHEGYGDKDAAEIELDRQRKRIRKLQERLYAERRQSLLVVLQAIDTGGKDGTIRHVFEGVNPQGCAVASFKVPTTEELDHDFLWRYHARAPARGMIQVFNRSHYEDVLVVRVKSLVPETVWRPRYDQINDFERLLAANGTTVLKFFLHISKDEQKRRLEARLADPKKHWKFARGDLAERALWADYAAAFEEAIEHCSTPRAPWHVVPANRKWFRNVAIARTIADTLEAMDPRFPEAEQGLEDVVVPD